MIRHDNKVELTFIILAFIIHHCIGRGVMLNLR